MEFKRYKLGEFIESVSDTTQILKDKVVLINTSDVENGYVINHTYTLNKNLKGQFKKRFKKGDILYSEIRPRNRRFAYIDFESDDYIASTKLMVLRNKGNIDNEFLFQLLKSNEVIEYLQLLAESRSGTFPQITFNELANTVVSIPSMENQQKISRILTIIDNKIRYNTHTNDNLFELTKQLYKRWFIEFEFPNKDGNPYKASNGKMVESELGLIPENWCIKRLDEISVNFDSKRKPLSSKDREERKGNIPYYGATSIIDYVNEYIFDDIFVLMGEDGSVINSDNTPVLQYIWKKCWINNHAHVLQGKGISTEHLMECLRATDVSSIITGAVQLKINQANMNALKYVYATEETNRDFDEKISKIYEKIRANIEQNEILEQLRDTLLPKLMNGEIDLDKIEI